MSSYPTFVVDLTGLADWVPETARQRRGPSFTVDLSGLADWVPMMANLTSEEASEYAQIERMMAADRCPPHMETRYRILTRKAKGLPPPASTTSPPQDFVPLSSLPRR